MGPGPMGPMGPGPMGPMGPGPMGPGPMGGMPGMPPGPMGPGPMGPGPMGPGPMGPPMGPGPMGGMPGMPPGPMGPGPGPMGGMPGMAPGPMGPGPMGGGMPGASPTTCPRCSAPALPGFAFCQQCGFRIGAPASSPGPAPIDAQGATLAATGEAAAAVRAGMMPGPGAMGGGMGMGAMPPVAASAPPPAPAPQQSAANWGVAVSVNRDGTDGERFSLAGEYVIVGRAGADISFDQDRFLARQHARLEPTAEGCRVVPIDTQNGVFRKIDAPVEIVHGSTVLVGREVLRFEKVDPDEKAPEPLVRHGVALFGSPPREPWGRLLQMLPSGGVRDVRHLWDDEITLGREEGDLVYSDDAFLSRRHCTIGWDGSRAVITDLGSSNGTFVRLAGVTSVKHGEHVRMGDQLFRIELRR